MWIVQNVDHTSRASLVPIMLSCFVSIMSLVFGLQDLSSFVTKSVKEIEHVMNVGNQNRSVG